jgi:hypothetical protein
MTELKKENGFAVLINETFQSRYGFNCWLGIITEKLDVGSDDRAVQLSMSDNLIV